MAGMLPGVEIHRRRSRTYTQRLHEDTPYGPGHPFYRSMVSSTTAMDETALRARQRLAEKLGYFKPSSVLSPTHAHHKMEILERVESDVPSFISVYRDGSNPPVGMELTGSLDNRLIRVEANEGSRGNRIMTRSTEDGQDQLVSRILGRRWHFQSNNSKSTKEQLCVVCLEDFGAEEQQHQQVIELPCSHKFHSKCLLPWLAAHPNCPSCRTPVQS